MIPLINHLNTKLINSFNDTIYPLGLANGSMGFCIHFYVLGRYTQNKEYTIIAEKILDEVFNNINKISAIDIKNGLAGIGLGVNYLISNNYVRGKVNIILEDIDSIILRTLSYPKYYKKIDTLSSINVLYYLCIRLKDQKKESENEYLYKESIIQIVNHLYELIDLSFYEEPYTYDTDYPLPQLLGVLSEIHAHGFYNYRINNIIEELSYKVLSTFPLLHSNRLHFLYGMSILNEHMQDKKWSAHIQLIKNQTDFDYMLNHEIKDKNIYFDDGATSIFYLIHNLTNCFNQTKTDKIKKQIIHKIRSSSAWRVLNTDPDYFNKHTGLYNGFTGTSILLHTHQHL